MIKEYFWVAVIGVLLNAALIIMDAAGFLPLSLINFVLVFSGVFALALYRPIWVFWLFIISLPLESVIISSQQFPVSFRPFQMIGLMLFLATVILIVLKIKNKNLPALIKFDRSKFFERGVHFGFQDSLVLTLGLLSFVSLANALVFGVTLKLNLVLLSFVMLYFLARFYLQERQRKLEALWFFVATSLPVLIFGIYQAVAFKMNWIDFQVFAERSNGTFTEPDWFGIYLVFLGAVIYWIKLQLFKTKNSTMIAQWEIRRVGQWFLNFYLFLIFVVLLLTVARSAWLGFLGVTITYFGLLIWQKYLFKLKRFSFKSFFRETLWMGVAYLLSILVVMGFGLSNFNLANRAGSSVSGLQEITISCQKNSEVPAEISSIEILEQYNCRHIRLDEIHTEKNLGLEVKKVFRPDPNIEIRKNIYGVTWSEIKKHPIIGQGLGSSSEVLGKDNYGHGLNASNIFLEVWFSWGILGLITFSILFLSPGFKAVKDICLFYRSSPRRTKAENKSEQPSLSLFVILTSGALIIPNLFNAGIFLVIFWIWLALINSQDKFIQIK
ncbi:MAG: O-antigen ligase family protein [Candidatus Moranbacteria bacterium]|nr:O-antigen ligase family protein [Candidatus Moranbacteria bacterium]